MTPSVLKVAQLQQQQAHSCSALAPRVAAQGLPRELSVPRRNAHICVAKSEIEKRIGIALVVFLLKLVGALESSYRFDKLVLASQAQCLD
jgi:hypothetical protein